MHVAWHTQITDTPLYSKEITVFYCWLFVCYKKSFRDLGFVLYFILKHICVATNIQTVYCRRVPRAMFDKAWVLPQQLTSLLMRRVLWCSQMVPPGTLPRAHTHACTCSRNTVSPCCTSNSCWLSAPLAPPSRQPLPLQFSPALSVYCSPSVAASLWLWQLLIHVTALQMSQLTSWENSRGGENRRREEESAVPPYLTENNTYWVKICDAIHDWNDCFSHTRLILSWLKTFSTDI